MDLLSVEPGLIFWTAVTFVLLLVILRRFAWEPILGALEAREEAIQRTIDEAERLQAEAERVLEEHQAKLAEAREEGNRILDEARRAGERMKSDIVEDAREEADQVVARARRQIELETEQALENLRDRAADLALHAAEKVVERSLSDADHRRFAEEAIEELSATGGGS